MPSAAVADDENGATKPNTTPNIRRSPAKRTPRNGSTPTRKAEDKKTPTPNAAGAKARTPNSAPANARRVSKKAEPTLLSDFLLGRPSPQRVGVGGRRKSLDVVKKEMKLEADVIGKVPHVGGVKDRVKQWQKANAAELVASKAEENKTGDSTDLEDGNSAGRDGDTNPRPGRRKSEEAEDEVPNGGTAKDLAKKRSKSAAAPKKRVVSDDHWMSKPEKKKSPPRKGQPIPKHFVSLTNNPPLDQKIKDWAKRNASEEPEEVPTSMTGSKPKPADAKPKSIDVTPRKGAPIPANFLTTTNNPPLAKKIDDWIKRSSSEQYTHTTKNSPDRETGYETPSKRKPSSQDSPKVVIVNEEDTRRRKKSPRQEQAKDAPKSANPSRLKVSDDGIRVRPSPDPAEDEIQIKPGKSNTVSPGDDGIRIRPKISDTPPGEKRSSMSRTPQTKGRKERRPSLSTSISDSKSLASGCQFSDDGRDDTISWTPSRKQSRRHQRKSDTQTGSLAEIPLGNSAFSVLDLPVGAEAGTLRRRVPPKRTPSFSVPKVFKKVYNEARNIVHDTADQQRPGIANPPSIESWLNGTSDPFIDAPAILKTSSEALESPPGVGSLEDNHQTEADNDGNLGWELHTRTPEGKSNKSGFGDAEKGSSDAQERLPSMGHSPANSPVNLKRTPATRGASSPKSARKTPLKEVFLDAFRGQSTTTPRSKGTTQEEISEFPNSRSPQEVKDANHNVGRENSSSQSPPAPGDVKLSRKREERQLPVFSNRPAPTTGMHRLSTIASVETFSTGSSLSETISELSKTTLTQDTHSTLPTESSLSRNTNNSGLKRRLTKHSDLLSVLSLPDPAGPEAGKSIRPARSVRTSRVRLETATIRGLMKELTDDEAKYLRELNTLVDGVIPVLLSSVLSKSKSAIAAGLFDANPGEQLDASFTRPIVDMGVALERLRSLHKRIPLGDPEAITSWAHGAYKTYSDYLAAWRMGFQDVVVNLAPASESPATSDLPTLDTMPRNANGDVVDVGGERVDVAFLLKRPLNRVKYLAKICKGINKLKTTDLSKMVDTMWEELESTAKRRAKEESARMVDRAAANTDPTRARDPSTLALAEDTKIDRTRQVCAKDYFFMDMPHSTGQRIECQVELLLRDNPSDKDDDGDILVCAVDNVSRWLLLTPLPKKYTSARLGDNPSQVVILVRGVGDSQKNWQETFLLQTDDNEAAAEWVEMLGKTPIPPALSSASPSKAQTHTTGAANTGGVDIPIGERRRREAEEIVTEQPDWQRKLHTTYVSINEDSMGLSTEPKDLNDAMRKAGQLASDKHAKTRRHNSFVYDRPSTVSRPQSSGSNQTFNSKGSDGSSSIAVMSGALPYTPQSAKTAKRDYSKHGYQLASPRQHESPPAPPAHRTPITPNTLKTSDPALDSPTPRAKNRRTSSPLKHEYQPFDSPHTSDSDFSGEDSSSSTDEELEETEPPGYQLAAAMLQGKRENHLIPGSDSKHTPGQSNLAKQASPDETPGSISSSAVKLTAMISCWSNKKGQWEDLHSEQCSIVVSPGLIEAFEMSASHSLPVHGPYLTKPNLSDAKHNRDEEANRPLLAIEITPFVNMRKSNGLDIEVHGAPKPNSLLKCKGAIRYRSPTPADCNQLYNAIHKSRMEIPAFIELEKAGTIDPYGANAYETAVKGRFGRNFFGRRRSYRASARAPPSTVEPSVQSNSSSVFSRLRHLGSGGRFNIAKSTLDSSPHQGFWSAPGSVYESRYSDLSGTPPGTPPSLSLAYSSNSRYGGNIGHENIKIRLYSLETNTRWDDKGEAAVTFSHPPHGMRQALAVNNGVENRVTVTLKIGKNEGDSFAMLDEVLGSNCFNRLGRTGVMFTVWEDIRGDGGEIGQIGRSGGVSGRTRKWLFQTNSQREAAWIYGLTQRSALTY